MPIQQFRIAWPAGCPSVMSSATDSDATTSDRRTRLSSPPTSSGRDGA